MASLKRKRTAQETTLSPGERMKLQAAARPMNLLDLPTEVRHAIFSYASITDEVISIRDIARICPLSHVNLQLRRESLGFFLEENVFYSEPGDDGLWSRRVFPSTDTFAHFVRKVYFRHTIRLWPYGNGGPWTTLEGYISLTTNYNIVKIGSSLCPPLDASLRKNWKQQNFDNVVISCSDQSAASIEFGFKDLFDLSARIGDINSALAQECPSDCDSDCDSDVNSLPWTPTRRVAHKNLEWMNLRVQYVHAEGWSAWLIRIEDPKNV